MSKKYQWKHECSIFPIGVSMTDVRLDRKPSCPYCGETIPDDKWYEASAYHFAKELFKR